MYNTKRALILYCLSPFQSCITLNWQYMRTYWKDNSKYVDGGRPPSFFAKNDGVDLKNGRGSTGKKEIFFTHKYLSN